MNFKKHTYQFLFVVIFCHINIFLNAQTVRVRTDKNQVLIGERIEYDLHISATTPGQTIDFELPDSLLHFEVLEKSNFDTSNNNGIFSLHQKIIFTSFDSGAWYIPSFPITLRNNNVLQKFMTDSLIINVGYSAADSTNQPRDIKPVIEVNVEDYFWYYVAGAVLLALILLFLLYRYFKNRNNKPLPVLHSAFSPYDEAIKDLEILSQKDLTVPAQIKNYHTQLGYILKRYYSRISGNNLLNKTTDGLLLKLKEQQPETTIISSIAASLRIGDAVKFAKYLPSVSESEICLGQIKDVIERFEKNKPAKI